jgi:hypothetical protein
LDDLGPRDVISASPRMWRVELAERVLDLGQPQYGQDVELVWQQVGEVGSAWTWKVWTVVVRYAIPKNLTLGLMYSIYVCCTHCLFYLVKLHSCNLEHFYKALFYAFMPRTRNTKLIISPKISGRTWKDCSGTCLLHLHKWIN